MIAEYTRLYPETSIDMTMTDRMVDMVEEGFDLAIRNMPIADSSLIVRKVAPYRFVICATPDYLEDPQHLAEKTVESHRANLLRKLGMRDRVELVRYAIRRGLVEP